MTDDGFEEDREAILERALDRAPFEGWTPLILSRAASDAGIDRSVVAAAFPRGIADLLHFWSEQVDAAMMAAMAGPEFARLRIREKVSFAIRVRIDLLRAHKEAARRAAALLALPFYGGLGLRLVWATADAVWRGLHDKSTDFNYYSKRAILSGVWTTTFARWLADDSEDEAATNAFLDRRIENVMQIEKLKSRLRGRQSETAAGAR